MGTRFQIILYAKDEAAATLAKKEAFARIAHLDATMTDYKATSELMQLCAKAGGDPVPVSEELFTVLAQAKKVSEQSDGAFDVTVGPVVRLWRLARRTQRLPDPDDLAKARALVNYKMMKLDPQKRTVQLEKSGMQLDLGGIGKGYAADEAIAVLKKHGITSALVAAGGDITVTEPPPGKKGWDVAIAPLTEAEKEKPIHLLLKNQSVSTSGDANQWVEIDGKRYSHIVDPRTGLGLVGRMSVTVVAPRGIEADSLTKVVCVLGPEKGFKVLADHYKDVSARYFTITEKGEKLETMKNFPRPTE